MVCKFTDCPSKDNGAFGAFNQSASRLRISSTTLIQGSLLLMFTLILLNLEEVYLLIVTTVAAAFFLMFTSKDGARKWLHVRAARDMPSLQTSTQSQFGSPRCIVGLDEKVQLPLVTTQPAVPRQPLRFQATSFEDEVEELLKQISRKPEGELIAMQCVDLVSDVVRSRIQVAAVASYVSGNCLIPSEYATVCPQIHVAMYVDIWNSRRSTSCNQKVRKGLIKTCTEQLVPAGFKFRRSALATDDPFVSMMTPPLPGCGGQSICIDFSVNTDTPLNLHNLVSFCSSIDRRAEALILLVRRWAQDRGIAHATAGHLSEYAWALLTVFFLQVAPGSDVGLPPITSATQFDAPQAALDKDCSLKSTADLFREFVAFYTKDFEWESESVSVRLARRAVPQIPANLVMEKGKQHIAPSIEDPFDLNKTMTVGTKSCIDSLHEELGRAYDLCARKASLSELLEPWTAA